MARRERAGAGPSLAQRARVLGVMMLLASQHEAETSDLLDLLDEVDPETRAEIEDAIDRGADLFELPTLIEDIALTARSRDGAIAGFALFSERWSDGVVAKAFFIGLSIDFDEVLFAPASYGTPPDERRRFELCRALAISRSRDPLESRALQERFDAAECGRFG
jgi:hypothetical protein